MGTLVTGSAGHLGEALLRTLRKRGARVIGTDERTSPFTDSCGSIVDPDFARRTMEGVDTVVHTATLHKPHVTTHSRQAFIDVNVTGTLNLLEAAVDAGVRSFVFTSTTSAFGHALTRGGDRANWITEDIRSIPKNIYGVTKTAAEDLCQLFHQDHGLPCVVLRTSRFFPEEDDNAALRAEFASDNLKVNELLHRRLDLADAVSGHLLAAEKAPSIGFDKFILTATTPFTEDQLVALRRDAEPVVRELFPMMADVFRTRGWKMYERLDRVYVNARARARLGWEPTYDFGHALRCLANEQPFASDVTREVGAKGYHYGTAFP